MRVFISADIEGIGCVVRGEHSSPEGRCHEFARQQMTTEVNAAARGAFDAGASRVVIADAHNIGLNLIPDQLDERVLLVTGSPRPLSMMEGVSLGFEAVFLIGYHAMAGTADSPINHTFTRRVAGLRLNGLSIGEIGLSAVLAGYYNTPVCLVTGDDRACAEAKTLLPDIETVEVKQGLGSYAAICLHPARCRELIYEGAGKALARASKPAPYVLPNGPVSMEVDFTTSSAVDRVTGLPGVERLSGVTVRYQGRDCLEAFKVFNIMTDLIGLVSFI